MDDIKFKRETKTYCGFPHNLLLPKSLPFTPDGQGGATFVLFAFVNDVEWDVREGMDGVEHM